MPVTMLQVFLFLFATLAVSDRGGWLEMDGDGVPVQLAVRDARARGAGARRSGRTRSRWLWQALWVALSIRLGARAVPQAGDEVGPAGAAKRRGAAAPRRRLRSGAARS